MIELRSDMIVELIRHDADDLGAVQAAQVSTKGEASRDSDMPDDKITGFINFLMRNRHGSPFEHNSMTFLIRAPIFVFREFHRHRIGWSYNEESGRYTKLRPTFYVPDEDRDLVQVGKPGYYEFVPGTAIQHVTTIDALRSSYQHDYATYEYLLEQDVAREVARACLPVAIYSSMYATCNARSLMNFLSLRTKNPDSAFPSYPQREIEMVAEKMEKEWEQLMPITHKAFTANRRVAP